MSGTKLALIIWGPIAAAGLIFLGYLYQQDQHTAADNSRAIAERAEALKAKGANPR